jgi:hypothetical protein
MAIAFWKGERAERIEVALFDAAPRVRPPVRGGTWEEADPLTTFDLKRFNAVRGYQAQQGREISRCLKELRALRKDAPAEGTSEPEPQAELPNEPRIPSVPANDDAPEPLAAHDSRREEKMQNEPERPGPAPDGWEGFDLPEATRTELDRLLAADDWPGLARLAATGALLPLGLGPADFASPAALGRALYTPRELGIGRAALASPSATAIHGPGT